jgi:hypothetical protein
MKIKITIPDYVSVAESQQLADLEYLTELRKVVKIISVLGKVDESEVLTWDSNSLKVIHNDLIKAMDFKEEFHPIFEHEGQLYGYANINKMTLGEYNDLERLCKEPSKNLHEIMAILYRPIKKHSFNSLPFKIIHKVRVFVEKVDDIFSHYTLKKYNSNDRKATAEIMKQLPAGFALGAMNFFLVTAEGYSIITHPSSTIEQKAMKKMMMMNNQSLLENIGAGLRQFIISPNQVYSISQATKVLLT